MRAETWCRTHDVRIASPEEYHAHAKQLHLGNRFAVEYRIGIRPKRRVFRRILSVVR